MKRMIKAALGYFPSSRRLAYKHYRLFNLLGAYGARNKLRLKGIEDIFTDYYRENIWINEESASGDGSTLEYTKNLRNQLPEVIGKFGIRSILDAPCGDYNWFRLVKREGVSYVGADIVTELVDRNNERFRDAETSFIKLDITKDPLPSADVFICRDALFHFSDADIYSTLNNFVASNIRYILTTSHTGNSENFDIITGQFRLLNLERPPFGFDPAIAYIDDWIEGFPERQMCLWTRESVAGFLETAGMNGSRSSMKPRYHHTDEVHNLKAPEVIVPDLIQAFHPASVVDVGCGLGTFLSVFQRHGVSDVLGIDGSWVVRDEMYIGHEQFKEVDLERPFELGRVFDLALSLEVAEHLRPETADSFVRSLCSLSKLIVFSAAVPGQTGQNHVNEQPFDYWREKFGTYGYRFYDIFRDKYWEASDVDWWYKQNMFLVAHESVKLNVEIAEREVSGTMHLHIPPELYFEVHSEMHRLRSIVDELKSVSGVMRVAGKYLGSKLGRPDK